MTAVARTKTAARENPNSHDDKLTTVGERNATMYDRLKNCKNQKAIRTLTADRAKEADRLIAVVEVEAEIDGIRNSRISMYVEWITRTLGGEMGTIRYQISGNEGKQGSAFGAI